MYPHQIDRLTAALEREGLEALVGTTAENVAYMTGFRSLHHGVFRTPQFAVWTPRGTALVVPAVDVPAIADDGTAVDHVVAFGDFVCAYADPLGPDARRVRERTERRAPSAGHALATALDALGLTGGRLGLDEGGLAPGAWEHVTGPLGSFTVVPAAAALLGARRVKSPYEIECLGRALGIAEEALNAVLQMLEPGVTEREAAAVYQAEVLRRDASLYPTSIAFGERTSIALPPPTARALRPGDLVKLDAGAIFKGYHSSVARTAVMGEPSARQMAVAEAVQTGLEAAIDALQPGVAGGQIHDTATAATRAAGLEHFTRGHVGHGIGLAPAELPKLAAGTATTLEAGEVLRIEVPHLEIGWGGVALRDTVLVTMTGGRALNRSARGLVVLD